jgi:hypothetical protein
LFDFDVSAPHSVWSANLNHLAVVAWDQRDLDQQWAAGSILNLLFFTALLNLEEEMILNRVV